MFDAGRTLARKFFRHRLGAAMETDAGTRAAAEITGALLAVRAGAVAVKHERYSSAIP
ncbi:hypothetical protein [Microvirga calopogonii]|uniref:hypothetical protein n=1 Tax=Microvirga calopogonii TaxID=2078013 RepID=UPI0013B35EA3|nr:hypothetical protein [Microvirga calopogonii]